MSPPSAVAFDEPRDVVDEIHRFLDGLSNDEMAALGDESLGRLIAAARASWAGAEEELVDLRDLYWRKYGKLPGAA